MGQVGKVDPAAAMAAIKPYVILSEDKAFKTWVQQIEDELNEMREFAWQVGGIDKFGHFGAALSEMGMYHPTSQAEMLQLFMCFRAVSNYWSNKMIYIKSMKLKYEFLEKQLKGLQKIERKDPNLKKETEDE